MTFKKPSPLFDRKQFVIPVAVLSSLLALSCGKKSSSSSSPANSADEDFQVQFDASNILHGFIPTEGQFAGIIKGRDSEGKDATLSDGGESRPLSLNTVVWLKDTTPYQTGLMNFSAPRGSLAFNYELTTLPPGVSCASSLDGIDFSAAADASTDEFVATGVKVIPGKCVYNIEAVAATLPADLVVLVNGTEVTIPASNAGSASFNIPVTSLKESDPVTWLPSSGTERPKFVTDNWDKIEKRSFVEDIAQIKNVKTREKSYTVTVKDTSSPCTIENGSAIMATQYHSEVSVTNSSQLITPALMNWHSDARTKLTINCLGTVKISPTSFDFGQVTVSNSSALQQFKITNGTEASITLGSFTTPGDLGLATPFAYQNGDSDLCYGGKTLAAGAHCNIKVVAYSTVTGSFSDALVMPYTSGAVTGSVTANVNVVFAP